MIVPTRNRPGSLGRCLESLRAVRYPGWEVVVVDQSDDEQTRSTVSRVAAGFPAHMVYVRDRAVGSARARNRAIPLSNGEILAFTDDDCTVQADWLLRVAEVFARHPEAGLVFGALESAGGDHDQVFVPVYEIDGERVLRGRLALLATGCMAASMYLRRSLWLTVGPLDPHTGAGARYAGEDRDFCYRVLAAGCVVVETSEVRVSHHGARDYASGAAARLFHRAAYSNGAFHMKLVRSGDPVGLLLIAVQVGRYLTRIRPGRPTGLAWIVMYIRGLFGSLRFGVDRAHRVWS